MLGTITAPPYVISVDTSVAGDGLRCYYAKAYDPAGNVGESSTNCVTVDNHGPPAPVGLVATAVSTNGVQLSWSVGSSDTGLGVAGCRVFRDGTQIATTLGTNYSDADLVAGTEYCYRVAAYDSGGRVSALSVAACARTLVPADSLSGTYYGLVMLTNAPSHAASGSIEVVAGKGGKFAANLIKGGVTSAFKGQFDSSGNALTVVLRKGLQPLKVWLHLDVGHATDQIMGTVQEGAVTSELLADRDVYSRTNPCPWAGTYTVVLEPPEGSNLTIPRGYGYGMLAIAKTGGGKLAGMLADGTKFSASAPVSRHGTWPLYNLLYKNQGSSLGWVTFTTNDTLAATVDWFRPYLPGSIYFANGFATNVTLMGEKFVSVADGGPSPEGAGTIRLGCGNLFDDIVRTATVDAAGNVTVLSPGEENLRLKLEPTTGQFSGSFLHPVLGKKISFKGMMLQMDGSAPAISWEAAAAVTWSSSRPLDPSSDEDASARGTGSSSLPSLSLSFSVTLGREYAKLTGWKLDWITTARALISSQTSPAMASINQPNAKLDINKIAS